MIEEGCQEFRPTWWQRMMWRFFPVPPRPRIEDDKRTFLTTEVYLDLTWADRLRVLLTGKGRLTVVSYTDIEVKDATSVSAFWVEL